MGLKEVRGHSQAKDADVDCLVSLRNRKAEAAMEGDRVKESQGQTRQGLPCQGGVWGLPCVRWEPTEAPTDLCGVVGGSQVTLGRCLSQAMRLGGQHLVKPQTHMKNLQTRKRRHQPGDAPAGMRCRKNPALAHPSALESTD